MVKKPLLAKAISQALSQALFELKLDLSFEEKQVILDSINSCIYLQKFKPKIDRKPSFMEKMRGA